MKLLLDQGTPRSMAALLRRAGFDAVHTGEIGLAEVDDAEIL
jgi:predicted nuclease of predicted toxin-antitoxin system